MYLKTFLSIKFDEKKVLSCCVVGSTLHINIICDSLYVRSRIGDFSSSHLFLYAGCAETIAAPFRVSHMFWIKNSLNPLYFNIFKPNFFNFVQLYMQFSFSKTSTQHF